MEIKVAYALALSIGSINDLRWAWTETAATAHCFKTYVASFGAHREHLFGIITAVSRGFLTTTRLSRSVSLREMREFYPFRPNLEVV